MTFDFGTFVVVLFLVLAALEGYSLCRPPSAAGSVLFSRDVAASVVAAVPILVLFFLRGWREAAAGAVLLTGFYFLYRRIYCTVLPYVLPPRPPLVRQFTRTTGDRVYDFHNPPTTLDDFLRRNGMESIRELLGNDMSLEQLSSKTDADLRNLGVVSWKRRRLLKAIEELPLGPRYFRELHKHYEEERMLPNVLKPCERIRGTAGGRGRGGKIGVITNSEWRLYREVTGRSQQQAYYKNPKWYQRPWLHRLDETIRERLELYDTEFAAERSAWEKLNLLVKERDAAGLPPSRELKLLRQEALEKELARRGMVVRVPTEKRVERFSDADHKAVHETQAFLAQPLPKLQAFFKQRGDDDDDGAPRHPPKLTSCACEFCWGAVAVVLFSRLLRAIREGTEEQVRAAYDALLRALVRINFCYSREHYLVCDVPEDGVKALLEKTTAHAAGGARFQKGLKVKLKERQPLIGRSFRAHDYMSSWPNGENKEALARYKYDELFFRASARPHCLFVVFCSVMVAFAGMDWSVGVLVCRALAGVVVAFVAQCIYNATCTPRARGLGYGVSNGSACVIIVIMFGGGVPMLLLGAPAATLLLGAPAARLLLPAPLVRLLLAAPPERSALSGTSSSSFLEVLKRFASSVAAGLGLVTSAASSVAAGLGLVTSAGVGIAPGATCVLCVVVTCAVVVAGSTEHCLNGTAGGQACAPVYQAEASGLLVWARTIYDLVFSAIVDLAVILYCHVGLAVVVLRFCRWARCSWKEGLIRRKETVDWHNVASRNDYVAPNGDPDTYRTFFDKYSVGIDLRVTKDPLVRMGRVFTDMTWYARAFLFNPKLISIMEDGDVPRRPVWWNSLSHCVVEALLVGLETPRKGLEIHVGGRSSTNRWTSHPTNASSTSVILFPPCSCAPSTRK